MLASTKPLKVSLETIEAGSNPDDNFDGHSFEVRPTALTMESRETHEINHGRNESQELRMFRDLRFDAYMLFPTQR